MSDTEFLWSDEKRGLRCKLSNKCVPKDTATLVYVKQDRRD